MAGRPPQCPACGAPVTDAWCGSCGLELASDEADALTNMIERVAVAQSELNAAWSHHDDLSRQLTRLRWRRVNLANGPTPSWTSPGSATTRATRPEHEWNVERVRNALLWTGAALLVCSALAFTAVAWTHLGPVGRAVLLFGLTIMMGALASATRNRLPATSGALTGLTIALALVDWSILRRAGVAPGVSSSAFWAVGTAAVAVASISFGRIAAPVPARRAAVLLLPTSALLTLTTVANALWSAAAGFSALAALLVVADRTVGRRTGDPVVRFALRAEAALSWVVAAAVATFAAVEPVIFVDTLVPAAVVASLAAAPTVALVRSEQPVLPHVRLAILVLLVGFGAALTLTSTAVGAIGQVTLVALLGCVALVAAPVLVDVWERAARRVGIGAATLGLLVAGSAALVAEFGPLSWFETPWTGNMQAAAAHVVSGPDTPGIALLGWCVVATLLAVAVSIPLATRGRPRDEQDVDPRALGAAAAGLVLLALAIVPVAADTTARVAFAAALIEVCALVAAGAIASRMRRDDAAVVAALAVVPLIPAIGWAAMSSTASIVGLSLVAVVAFAAAAISREPSLRAGDAVLAASATATLSSVIALAAGASAAASGFAAATAAVVLLVIGSQLRRDTPDGVAVEVTGVVGIVIGAMVAARSVPWLAGTLTVAVPCFGVAALRSRRRVEYGVAAGAAALSATWAWLAAADVRVVEAYTLPAALAALAAGALASRDLPARSWLAFGPAIVLALGPTLVMAIARNDDTRAILVGSAALAVVLAGAARRLQAPIVLGAAALLVLGIDKLGPPAARLPRWLMLALAGSILLWVGTTFERRRADVQRALRGFERLG